MSQTLGSPLVVKSNATLPVEVLAHIARHLDRLDMQALLLTSKEYNAKLGPLYFQHVVLQFKSNIFSGVKNNSSIDSMHGKETGLSSATLPAAPAISTVTGDSGEDSKNPPSELNMFKSWGSSIMKFGFSLEADQDELTNAPKKQIMNTYTSFYEQSIPWPAQEYLLNPTIQRLEITADQKNLMELAFSSLTNVNELALAVDSGLGYLEGFDRSDRAKIVADKAKFFGRRFALSKEDEIRSWLKVGSSALARFSLHDRRIYEFYVKKLQRIPRHRDTLIGLVSYYMNKYPRGTLTQLASMDIFGHVKTIMLRAGVIRVDQNPQEWSTFEEMLLANGLTETDVMTGSIWNQRLSRPTPRTLHGSAFFDPASYDEFHTIASSGGLFPEGYRHGSYSSPPVWEHTRMFSYTDGRQIIEVWDKFGLSAVRDLNRALLTRLFYGTPGSPAPIIFDGIDVSDQYHTPLSQEAFDTKPLKPRLLTLAQKQWLVETGWMQQAFMTSYLTSIIKNKSRFATVRSFTLAKLSSRYLPRLHDREFWDALCQLENLTILVSADWREIIPGHEGEFSSRTVAPSRACSMLMKLLYDLSSIARIKSLKTGYVGGGEHAVGLHARNQHILPAPIADEERSKRHIVMPYIENLTFVNCWFVPSMLTAFLKDMISMKLRTVNFDSVSLLVAGGKTTYFPITWPGNFPQELVADPSTGTIPPLYLGFGVRQPSWSTTARQSQITPAYVLPQPPMQDGYVVPVSWRSQRLHADTWAKIIDAYTPGQTLKDKKAALAGEAADPRSHVARKRLASLKFASCGYAKLGYQQLGHVLDEPQGPREGSFLNRRKANIEVYMMRSEDPFLGEIVPKLIHPELALLTGGFGMTVGPGDDPGRLDNREDGKWDRGTGRFSGEV
ncbi:hypothetical protein MMC17_002700 [Xylographa soralifera]|nr:hypothetical protein [Xylographa soralifera]